MGTQVAKNPELLLQAMKEHELVIARLYETYAKKFPEWENFWTGLSKEEEQHANWIEQLAAQVRDNGDMVLLERFPIAAIETSIDYISRSVARAQEPDFELINALSIALHLEEALIENKYFEVLDKDGPQVAHTLNQLADSTRNHLARVRKAVQENR